jgi:hypothetical protein
MSAAAGPGGGATLGRGASVAPPLTLPPVEQAPAATTDSRQPSKRRVNTRRCTSLVDQLEPRERKDHTSGRGGR